MEKNKNELVASDFVHLHNHTQYSLLDGLTKVPELMKVVQDFGMDSVAITDHGTLSGAIEFYKEAKSKNIKPIIGIETYVAQRKLENKEASEDKSYFHLIILAMNKTGYENLMRLSSIANLEGFYYKPRIDRDILKKYNEGLIVLSGCISGEFGDALRQEQEEKAIGVAMWYKEVFGDRYYIEIQDHGHEDHPGHWSEQKLVNERAIKIAQNLQIPMVITGDAHYLKKEDKDAHEILLCVQTGSFLSDEKRMSLKEFELNVADPRDIIKRWSNILPDAIINTKKIADRCNVEIELGKYLIPKFPVPKGKTEKSYLDLLTFKGLVVRYAPGAKDTDDIDLLKKALPEHVLTRVEYELSVIDRMGFNGYFLIVQDFINWGKNQDIVFGPGRGSGAGSVIAYGLKITELDPFKYELLFERFLNPDRISMPDFDIDIQDTRREEVIQYCVEKYGKDKVANIVTFGRMAARNAVRDVARVLQVPYSESDRLAKMIPPPIQGRHIPLRESLKDNAELAAEYKNNQQSKEVFDLAIKLEGTIRSHGVHAAGVVIAPDEIVKFTPLEMAQKGVVSTQYSMGPVDEIGLLKVDFLGLSNLTIIRNTLRIIKKVYDEDIDIGSIDLEDEKTFNLFQKGDTTGVFQFESAGMKRYLKQLQPTRFDDLIAMNALYRPGPMQWIDDFIARKHGEKSIEYLHPALEPSLKSTYGILVYQEQFMQISKDLCGFTGGQADTLRKAVGKKIVSLMKKVKADFIEGAIKKSNVPRETMEVFWKQLEDFAAYCFNKAHAACYAMIAYQTAYLKSHYPAAFMAALMTSDYDDTDRLSIEISECKSMGIDVLPPDINESFGEFSIVKNKENNKEQIRFGLNAIKNVGVGSVDELVKNREENGKYDSLEDLLSRANSKTINRKILDSLIKCGALDSFADRSILMSNIDNMLAFASRQQKQSLTGQTDLFGGSGEDASLKVKLSLFPAEEEITDRQQLIWERELLGIYLSKHPLEDYEEYLSENSVPIGELKNVEEKKQISIGGTVTEVREITTKNGKKMAFVKLADVSGEIELIIFPGSLEKTADLWKQDIVILAKGKVSSKDKDGNSGEVKFMLDNASELELEKVKKYKPKGKNKHLKNVNNKKPTTETRVYIRISSTKDQDKLIKLKKSIDQNPGLIPVVLVVGNEDNRQIIKLPSCVEPTEDFISNMQTIFGQESVKYQ